MELPESILSDYILRIFLNRSLQNNEGYPPKMAYLLLKELWDWQ